MNVFIFLLFSFTLGLVDIVLIALSRFFLFLAFHPGISHLLANRAMRDLEADPNNLSGPIAVKALKEVLATGSYIIETEIAMDENGVTVFKRPSEVLETVKQENVRLRAEIDSLYRKMQLQE